MCSTHYIFLDFLYVIEECISFHLVYRLLLLQFVLGWAIFYLKSPRLLCHLIHLTIIRTFTWPCLACMPTQNGLKSHSPISSSVPSLCSEGSMFRKFYIPKVLYAGGSMFRRFCIPKVLCSEGSIFRRFYVSKVLCSEGSMFRMPIGPMIHCP